MNGFRMEATNVDQYLDDVQNETTKTDQAVQRSFSWNNECINNLIYSAVSQEVFIPNLILAEETKDGIKTTYVIDGGHRTEALRRFRYSDYKITSTIRNPIVSYNRKKRDKNGKIMKDEYGSVIWETCEFDLRNKRFEDLPKELQKKFEKCPLMTTIYQDCTPEETSGLVNLYNNHIGMNVSQKALTYIGKYARDIKKIKDNNVFLKDGTMLTEADKHKGLWERIISEVVMAIFHMEDWKKDPKKMCDFLNSHSSTEEFQKVEEYFNRLSPYSDKLENPKVAELFVSKNMAVWMYVFVEFTKLELPDEKFGEFLNTFVNGMEYVKVNDISWSELDADKHTKDKAVIEQKINHITYLMKEFLHIEDAVSGETSEDLNEEVVENQNEVISEAETTMEDNNVVETVNEATETIEEFIKRNVPGSMPEIDMELYEDTLKDWTVDITHKHKLLEPENEKSLYAMMAYSYANDVDLGEWLFDYFNRNSDYIENQDENFLHMVSDLSKYIEQKEKENKEKEDKEVGVA